MAGLLSVKFLSEHRDLAKKIATANAELTQWIQANPEEAQKLLIAELKEETKASFAPEAVKQAWKRIKFTTEVAPELVTKAVQDGKDAGFLKGATDTSKLARHSVMARARIRSSATEELEIIPPTKLAIENVSKSFSTATGNVQALDA